MQQAAGEQHNAIRRTVSLLAVIRRIKEDVSDVLVP